MAGEDHPAGVPVIAGAAVALVAAAVFAVAANLQHFVTRSAARSARMTPFGIAARLLMNPIWWLGFLGNFIGFLLHAVALRGGDVSLVQAILVVQLLFALPLATLRNRIRPRPRDWLGTAAVCAGIATLGLTRQGMDQTVDTRAALAVGGLGLCVVATFITASRLAHPPLRTAFLGLAAGTTFSITATFIVVVVNRVTAYGLLPGLLAWPTATLACSGLLAAILVQWAFASGSLPAALTAMTVGDPVASWVWSVTLFDTSPIPSLGTLAMCVGAGVMLVTGVATLAYSPTLRDTLPVRKPEPDPSPAIPLQTTLPAPAKITAAAEQVH